MLSNEILKYLKPEICDSKDTYKAFIRRLNKGLLTHFEDVESHFVIYFLPFNPKTKEILIVHHKDADLWLVPGGHIEKNEKLLDALNREVGEELGLEIFFKKIPLPFLLTITPIESNNDLSKEHFDIWYLLEAEKRDLQINTEEFKDHKWLSIEKAKEYVTDKSTRTALSYVDKLYS